MKDDRNETQRAHLRAPTPKRRTATPEAKVSAAVRAYLDGIGAITLRSGAGLAHFEGRTVQVGQAGWSDFTVCLPLQGGQAVFAALEIKSATGRVSPAQQAYLERVRAAGGVGLIVRSVEDLRTKLCAVFGPAQLAVWDAALAAEKERQRQLRLRPEKRGHNA